MINPITKKFYYVMDGDERVKVSPENAESLGVAETYTQFLEAESVTERAWRNQEYALTDPMVSVPDYTYGGEVISGSSKLDDIFNYRSALKSYNLTTDDRPTRPEWLK